MAVEVINGTVQVFGNSNRLINSIRSLMANGRDITCTFQGRESNACADWIAKKGPKSNSDELFTFLHPPDGIWDLLSADYAGVVPHSASFS